MLSISSFTRIFSGSYCKFVTTGNNITLFLFQTTESVIALATVLTANKTLRALNVNRPLLFSEQEETTVHFAKVLKVKQTIICHDSWLLLKKMLDMCKLKTSLDNELDMVQIIDKKKKSIVGKRRKCWSSAFSPFPNNFFKRRKNCPLPTYFPKPLSVLIITKLDCFV